MSSKTKAGELMLPASIYQWMLRFGDDFGYMPLVPVEEPSQFEPGSPERVRELRQRVRQGQPLFSRKDLWAMPPKEAAECATYATDPVWPVWSGNNDRGSEQSGCGRWKYRAWEYWDRTKPTVLFVGLAPEKASERSLRKKFSSLAKANGCGGYQHVNLFSLVCESRDALWLAEDPTGDWNDRVIRVAAATSSFVVCGWGLAGRHQGRSSTVLAGLIRTVKSEAFFCFGLTERYVSPAATGGHFYQPVSFAKVDPDAKVAKLPLKALEIASNE